jgi:hypothetical protein
MSAEQAERARLCTLDMLNNLRPNFVALVDANEDISGFRLICLGYQKHSRLLIIVDGVGIYSGTASRL